MVGTVPNLMNLASSEEIEPLKFLNRGRAKHFQCNLEL